MREHRARTIATCAIALLVSSAQSVVAQAGFGHLDDASVVPRGLFRFRSMSVWTRYDERFAASGVAALGAPFTTDSLGTKEVPELRTADSLVGAASASPFTLSLGRSHLDAMVREEALPFMLEYGLTRRFSLGLMVPVRRKRLAGLFRLDSLGANVGPNPRRLNAPAAQTNALVQTQFTNAVAQLQSKLQSCTSNPAGSGCAALLARQAEAQALIQSSQAFASAVGSLYGTSTGNGEAFVPRAQSAAQSAIAARVSDFNLKYRDLLASAANFVTAVPVGAAGPPGSSDIENYVTGELGRDSIATKQVLGVGDMEFGFKFLAADSRRFRLAVASSVRLPTGTRQAPVGVADLRIGDGALGFDARAIMELSYGRLGLYGATTFTMVGASDAAVATDSRRASVDLAPQWHVTAPLSIYGAWSLRTADLSGTVQLVGGGVSFTTVNSYAPGTRPLPLEMRYTHFETARGDVGAPKFTRDQLELRVYYQPRGR